MAHRITSLNGKFGILIEDVSPSDLAADDFRAEAHELWLEHGGLLAVRGAALAQLAPQALVSWGENFGRLDQATIAGREHFMVAGLPITRLGNTRDPDGQPNAVFALVPMLRSDDDVRYDPDTRRPVWHTDSTFKRSPPIGSVFHCRTAPPRGSDTLFADTRQAFAAFAPDVQERLRGLEAVCSLAHHDKKISLYSPGYHTLSANERAANPPNRVPLVLDHPVTGAPALYGLNSSTCAIVPTGESIPAERMDAYDLEGLEDPSVLILRDLLPEITAPEFTVRWRWQAGDVLVWDNRCTLHAASGFEHERYEREMWRLTLLEPERPRASNAA